MKFIQDFGGCLLETWPILLFGLVVYPLVAAWILRHYCTSDKDADIKSQPYYYVLLCMTTLGWPTPVDSPCARRIAITSGILGWILLGLVAGMVMKSLEVSTS